MRNIHPLRTVRRRGQRIQKLGHEHPFCLSCGCTDPMLLRRVTKSFLEKHHVFGRANDRDSISALCFNCHALATEGLLAAGVTMNKEPDSLKFAINMFRANEFNLRMLSEASGRFAAQLEKDTDVQGMEHSAGIDIITFIFQQCWPIWRAHRGKVPDSALRQLERDGDWPCGCARAAMKRISKDENLRFELQTRCR